MIDSNFRRADVAWLGLDDRRESWRRFASGLCRRVRRWWE